MRILFVDDDPQHVDVVQRTVAEALDAEVWVVSSVEEAVAALHEHAFDLVVTDIFIPLGTKPRVSMGPRSRKYEDTVQHLGGLVLLDELDRVVPAPKVLAHTACTDTALIEILGSCVSARVPKPAPVDVLLRAVIEALDLPAPQ
jgi:CheY-like chemotaxis protein